MNGFMLLLLWLASAAELLVPPPAGKYNDRMWNEAVTKVLSRMVVAAVDHTPPGSP
jgi:hypothetical protein